MMRARLRKVGLAVALFGLLFGASVSSARDDVTEKELKVLNGKWTAVWVFSPGAKKRKPGAYDRASITFDTKKGKASWPDVVEGGEDIEATYSIDASKNPKWLNLTWGSDKTPWKYIYKLQGDELWIGHVEQKRRPGGFNGKVHYIIYKRK